MGNKIIKKGLDLILVTFVLILCLTPTKANWYGKRGDKVDSGLFSLLQGTLPDMMDRQIDAQMTLRAIGKLVQEYELRQLQDMESKGGTK